MGGGTLSERLVRKQNECTASQLFLQVSLRGRHGRPGARGEPSSQSRNRLVFTHIGARALLESAAVCFRGFRVVNLWLWKALGTTQVGNALSLVVQYSYFAIIGSYVFVGLKRSRFF